MSTLDTSAYKGRIRKERAIAKAKAQQIRKPNSVLSTVDKTKPINVRKERAKQLGIGAGNWQPSASYSIRIKTELAV